MFKAIESLGIVGAILAVLMSLVVAVAVVCVYINGVVYGFAHGILIGLVSLLPPVGFIEGLLHLLHILS